MCGSVQVLSDVYHKVSEAVDPLQCYPLDEDRESQQLQVPWVTTPGCCGEIIHRVPVLPRQTEEIHHGFQDTVQLLPVHH